MTEIQSYAIKNIRVVSTLMIFLCHTVFLFGDLIGKTAQFFNIAVTVFFFISAYLYSIREKCSQDGVTLWYKKRLIRIIVPYYIFLFVLFILFLIFHQEIIPLEWITTGLIIAGVTETPVVSTGHLWFITAIIVCYIITPLLYKIRENKKATVLFLSIILVGYFPVALFIKDIVGTYYSSVLEYILAFFFLKLYIERVNKKTGIIVGLSSLIAGCLLKLLFIYYFDNTILYTKFLVEVCSLIIGFGIFTSIYYFVENTYRVSKKFEKVIDSFDSFSYEFYIVHMVFIQGCFSVFVFENPFINIVIAFILSLLFGYLLHILSNKILKVTKWKTKH
ncbi:MAG: acyltransferase [Ruminococcus sp.]|nr:acyltransferase [Ruminococcus sp.]